MQRQFFLCSAQVFTVWAGAGPKKSIIDHLPQSVLAGIPTIISYCEDIRDKVFNAALGNKDNKLNKLLTEANKAPYLLRNHRHFALPKWKTDRFKNTFCFVIVPKVQLNDSVWMLLYIICMNF